MHGQQNVKKCYSYKNLLKVLQMMQQKYVTYRAPVCFYNVMHWKIISCSTATLYNGLCVEALSKYVSLVQLPLQNAVKIT